jgi:hypothetical protein
MFQLGIEVLGGRPWPLGAPAMSRKASGAAMLGTHPARPRCVRPRSRFAAIRASVGLKIASAMQLNSDPHEIWPLAVPTTGSRSCRNTTRRPDCVVLLD